MNHADGWTDNDDYDAEDLKEQVDFLATLAAYWAWKAGGKIEIDALAFDRFAGSMDGEQVLIEPPTESRNSFLIQI